MVGKLVRIFDILSTIQRSPIFRQTQIHPYKQHAHTHMQTYQLTEPFKRQLTEKEKRNRHKRASSEQHQVKIVSFGLYVTHSLGSPIRLCRISWFRNVFVGFTHTIQWNIISFFIFLLQFK